MSSGNRGLNGVFWSFVERFSAKAVQFIIGILIARMLDPKDYGLLGMILIFVSLPQVFVDGGFSKALIQKSNRDEKDFTTVFYFNFLISSIFYVIVFCLAPLASIFYDEPTLTELVRIIGLNIPLNALVIVQQTRYTIQINFKAQSVISLVSSIVGGIGGIYWAYNGYGVFALVYQILLRSSISALLYWRHPYVMPFKNFSMFRLKELFGFGSKLLLARLINTVYNNIYLLLIGKYFSAVSLGYFTRAKQFVDLPSVTLMSVVQKVSFPLFCEVSRDVEKLKLKFRGIIRLTALVSFPLMIGLAILAKPIVLIMLTEKWLEAVWFLQVLCVSGALLPIHSLNLSVLNAMGRSDLFLKIEVAKKVIITLVIFCSIPFGIEAFIVGIVLNSFIFLGINGYYSRKLLDYSIINQLGDIKYSIFIAVLMGVIIHPIISAFSNSIMQLILGLSTGSLFYIYVTYRVEQTGMQNLISLMQKKLNFS